MTNERKLGEVLQRWMHPASQVREDELNGQGRQKKKRKHVYEQEINEDNLFECFYDIVQEVMHRMKKVQLNIKNTDRWLGKKGQDEEEVVHK